jgi:hypothetical protein
LQKACTNAQFQANPAACPAASKIGYATVRTQLLPVPLTGPAIFVSRPRASENECGRPSFGSQPAA